MRVLLDTNIILDVLLNRSPWVKASGEVWQAIDKGQITGYIAASTITDMFYIVRKLAGLDRARNSIQVCLNAFEFCEVNRQTIEFADRLQGKDFEDNLQIACAELNGLDAIVTRDKGGFKETTLLVLEPDELLAQIP